LKTEPPNYEIYFHQVACFSIHCDGIILIFDPHDGKSMQLNAPTIRDADVILCTHKHYDHNNGIALVKKTSSFILEEQEGEFHFHGIKIYGTKVRHGGDPNWGFTVVYTVQFPSGLIFIHGGDIGCPPTRSELESILRYGQPEVIILPIGGFFCLNAIEAIQTAELVHPNKTTIVCHYLYGPLLTKDDFRGMTTERPFLDLIGNNCQILDRNLISTQQYKEYVLFSP
jgi:L-ascorbate metabolism protein UlaG (beta-lactamase superfamily)